MAPNGTELVSMVQIDVDIFEPQGISKLDAQASFLSKELAAQTIKKSFSGKKGHVLFRPTVSQQQSCPTCSTSLLNGDFKVTYDVNRDKLCDLLVSLRLMAQALEGRESLLGERSLCLFSVPGGQQLLYTFLCPQKPDQLEQEPGFCD